jgi:hypothetical protein
LSHECQAQFVQDVSGEPLQESGSAVDRGLAYDKLTLPDAAEQGYLKKIFVEPETISGSLSCIS